MPPHNHCLYSQLLQITLNIWGGGSTGSVAGWGTMLQAGRERIWFPVTTLNFFNWSNLSSSTMALELTQRLTEMSSRNLPGDKGWPALKADNLTAICEPSVYKVWEPRRLTNVWAATICYRDSFTFLSFNMKYLNNSIAKVVFSTADEVRLCMSAKHRQISSQANIWHVKLVM
jgi:hypothetical protein